METKSRTRAWSIAGLLLLAAVLLATIALTAPPSHVAGIDGGTKVTTGQAPVPTPRPGPTFVIFTPSGSSSPSMTTWIAAALAVVALVGAVAIWMLARRRRKSVTPADVTSIGSPADVSPLEPPNSAVDSQRKAS